MQRNIERSEHNHPFFGRVITVGKMMYAFDLERDRYNTTIKRLLVTNNFNTFFNFIKIF